MIALSVRKAVAAAVPAAVKVRPAGTAKAGDEFVFQISKDEYLDLLFEDLALPNLKKNQHRQLNEYKTHRAGFTSNGVPANISVVRSLQNSLARRTAMTAGKRRELHALETELETISHSEPAQLLEEERLRREIAELRAKIERVPFIDTFDLRYKNYEKRPEPSSRAVMFCLMDVSGSMDQGNQRYGQTFLHSALSVFEPNV